MDSAWIDLPPRKAPLVLPWPEAGAPGGFVTFESAASWRDVVAGLSLSPFVSEIVSLKYARAQKLYLLGWIDTDLIKAGELVALTTLELAVTDRYGHLFPKRRRNLSVLLKHMVEGDGLHRRGDPDGGALRRNGHRTAYRRHRTDLGPAPQSSRSR